MAHLVKNQSQFCDCEISNNFDERFPLRMHNTVLFGNLMKLGRGLGGGVFVAVVVVVVVVVNRDALVSDLYWRRRHTSLILILTSPSNSL